MLSLTTPDLGTRMSTADREAFERNGFLLIPGALSPEEVTRYRTAVTHCPELVGLLDHPAVFAHVWSLLGWNPRPRMSVKLAFWLSDVSRPGRGNLTVLPGSHRVNWLDGPPRRDVPHPTPEGAVELTVEAGDVLLFDRRLWHARSDNYSDLTRKVVFVGYTYRWITIRDEVADLPGQDWFAALTPVQRGLLDSAQRYLVP